MDRYGSGEAELGVSSGWQIERVAGPSPLFGANGMRFGPDGRLFVAQAFGSGEVRRIDLPSRSKTRLAEVRPGIDDFAFSADGRLFLSHFVDDGVTEITAGGDERRIERDPDPVELAEPGRGGFRRSARGIGDDVARGVPETKIAFRRHRDAANEAGEPRLQEMSRPREDAVHADHGGIVPKPLPGLPGFIPGPIGTFAGIAASSDGSIYVAADGEGSVLRLRRTAARGARR